MEARTQARTHGAERTASAGARTIAAIACAWCFAVGAAYYTPLWSLLASGPGGWSVPQLGQDLWQTGVPHAGEAARRTASAVAAAAVIVLAIFGLGRSLDRWLTPQDLAPFEIHIVRYGNGAGALGLALLALALAGAFQPRIVRGVTLLPALICVAWLVRHRRARRLTQEADSRLPGAASLGWAAVTTVAAAIAFVTALAPETAHDALWYQLELPRRWLADGRPVDDVNEYISLYPLHWNLVFAAALAFDGSVAARLLHWTTLLASAGIAAAMAHRAFGVRNKWIAPAVFVTAPTVLWEASSAYVDLALAMHCGIGAGALWMSTRAPDRRWLWLAGAQFGVACATKHLGLVLAATAFSLYALDWLRRASGRDVVVRLAIAGLLTLVIPSPWYARAWFASGNPVFPELYGLFGARPPERWDALAERGLQQFKARFGSAETGASSGWLPWDMTMHAASYGGTLGPILLLAVPGFVLVLRRSPAARWLAAGAALYLVVWASPLSSLQLRFLVPWWLPVSALAAAAIVAMNQAAAALWRPAGGLAYAMWLGILLLNVPPFTPLHERDRVGWSGWLTHVIHRVPVEAVLGGWSTDEWLRSQVTTYAAWAHLNALAPPNARVLTFFSGDHFYSARTRVWSESVAARPVTWGATSAEASTLRLRLAELGITHVIAPRRFPHRTAEHDALAILRPDVTSGFAVVHEDYWATVYSVARDEPRGSGAAAAAAGAALRTDQR